MSRQLKFLIAISCLALVFLYAVSDILLPFVLGLSFAYLLDPVADKLEKRRIPRGAATIIITLVFFTVTGIACVTLLPVIFDQISDFIKQLPEFYKQFHAQVIPQITAKLKQFSPEMAYKLNAQSEDVSNHVTEIIGESVTLIFSSGVDLLGFASLILITPIVTFYLLRDWDLFVAKVDSLLPRDYAPVIRQQVKKIDDIIGAFIHGQLNACLLMGVVYALGLTIAGLKFGLVIGFVTGLLIFIPFVGIIIGASVGIMVAYFQFPFEPERVMFVAAIFLVIHIVEANLISPRIIGGKIGIHPAWLMFGMLAGGSLLGFVGVIISVPLTAIIGVLVRFAVEQYSSSAFYESEPKKVKSRVKKAKQA